MKIFILSYLQFWPVDMTIKVKTTPRWL